ncbi:MAG: hypothetical protein ACOCZW_05780, partial [Bacteroidota bacterium]
MDPKQGYILFSGGAPGTEDEFGRNAELYGIEEVNYSFEGHENNRYRGLRVLNSRELEHGDISLTYASNLMNREYPRTRKFRKILQSIWYQVVSSRQVFVVGRILEDHTVKGGTGWGAEFAKITNKPLFVFDQEKTIRGLKKGLMHFLKILPTLLSVIIIISIILHFISNELLMEYLGESAGWGAYFSAAVIGSVA